jgi:hypothetical protein
MAIGRGEEEEQRQARAATEERVDPVAQEQCAGMMVRGMTDRGIRVGPAPGQDRRAVHDEVASAHEAQVQRQAGEHD